MNALNTASTAQDTARTFHVGQEVIFHSQWPFEQHRATVIAIGERKREYSDRMETFVTLRYRRSSIREDGDVGTCETWNARLRPA